MTAEVANAFKDYLSRYFGWTEQNNTLLQDIYVFGSTTAKGRKSKTPGFDIESAKLSLQKSLWTHVGKIPDLDVVNENGYKAIHFHAFRKFFRTIMGNAVGRDCGGPDGTWILYGHILQLPEDRKMRMYLDVEPHLTISDTESMENNLKSLSEKYISLETKVNDLFHYLCTKSIKVPDYLK